MKHVQTTGKKAYVVSLYRSGHNVGIHYGKTLFINLGGEWFGLGILFKSINGINVIISYYLRNNWCWGPPDDHVGTMGRY